MKSKNLVITGSLPALKITRSDESDLATINGIIERAVLRWPMSMRVKRRAVPILQYDTLDMASYTFFRCEHGDIIVGAIALDFEYSNDDLACNELLVHGIYVDPVAQGRGIGLALIDFAERQAREHNFDGVALKAERVSRGFFEQCGYFHSLPQTADDYPYFYRKRVGFIPLNLTDAEVHAQ